MLQDYPQLTLSDMALADAEKLLVELEGEKLESFKENLKLLNGMKAKLRADIPRDGRNFSWSALGMEGGLIDHGTDYSLHS